jgi:hypothetical protein
MDDGRGWYLDKGYVTFRVKVNKHEVVTIFKIWKV